VAIRVEPGEECALFIWPGCLPTSFRRLSLGWADLRVHSCCKFQTCYLQFANFLYRACWLQDNVKVTCDLVTLPVKEMRIVLQLLASLLKRHTTIGRGIL
jgi:hypothetical protein